MRKTVLLCSLALSFSSGIAFTAKTADTGVVFARTQGSGQIKIPKEGQNGRPLEITVPSDSNVIPAEVTIDGQRVEVLNGSPRRIVVTVPSHLAGPVKVRVKQGDHETEETCRVINVHVTAPKTNLIRGERAIVTVTVTGLDGIKRTFPLHLTTSGVIKTDGGNVQFRWIHPEELQHGNTYTTTVTITGVQAGAFNVTATVLNSPLDIPFTAGGTVNRFRVKKKDGKFVGLTMQNAQSPITGDPLEGEYEVVLDCMTNRLVRKLVFKKGQAELALRPLDLQHQCFGPDGTMFGDRRLQLGIRFEF